MVAVKGHNWGGGIWTTRASALSAPAGPKQNPSTMRVFQSSGKITGEEVRSARAQNVGGQFHIEQDDEDDDVQ